MLMGTRTCMNILCGATGSHEWKRGWVLGSGIIASLCYSCGSAYEQQVFCETFHADETGWRGCTGCGKRLHCGCIASLPLIELLDTGGVKCISCAKDFGDCGSSGQKLNGPRPVTQNNGQLQHLNSFKDLNGSGPVTLNNGKMQHLNSFKDLTGGKNQIIVRKMEPNMVHEQLKKEAVSLSHADAGSRKTPPVISLPMVTKDFGTFISLGGPASSPHPLFGAAVEEKEQGNTSSGFQLGTPSRQLLPKPSKLHLSASTDKSTSTSPLMRIPRPPVEGRGRNQMLPRYWPRITEQELQQISGDPNCTVVPLFEKVLSASDAGRIGRLVLPKACAEAYFPPISQPEGLPLKIQDIKGKEWVFQFRFWPNNNSRMYVLEGVTPCIQSMQLQAGDTVIFSRMDPEGKLVMGCRKASPALQSMKGAADPHINGAPKQTNSEHIVGNNGEKHKAGESAVHSEKKRYRNIGLKNKRLFIDGQDVIELKLTWEEVQDMLRVPKNSKPTVTMIEDSEIEEYEEPPVFGKWSIFGCRSTGVMEQWTQCDSCLKWRRLPPDVLLPPKWTCVDNVWDQSRCSCSAPDHLTPRDIENLLLLSKDCKKKKFGASDKAAIGQDPCGLETLANVATIQGDNASDSAPGPSSTGATTTKHPRHKPGCTCIVCIQPPSGKGKHKPMCDCNVCSTVKRRFQTLMLRKRKRQSVQEGEIANGKDPRDKSLHNHLPKDEAETEGTSTHQMSSCFDHPTVEGEGPTTLPSDPLTINEAAKLDLNFDPQNEGKVCDGLPTSTMTSLLQLASHPLDSSLKQIDKSLTREQLESCMKQNGIRSLTEQLDSYMKQNGLKSSSTEQQVSSGLSGSVKVTREAKNQKPEDQTVDCTMKESDEVVDGSCSLDRNPYGTP